MRFVRAIVGIIGLSLALSGCGVVSSILWRKPSSAEVATVKLDVLASPDVYLDNGYANGARRLPIGELDMLALSSDHSIVIAGKFPPAVATRDEIKGVATGIDAKSGKPVWMVDEFGLECLPGGWNDAVLCAHHTKAETELWALNAKTGERVKSIQLGTFIGVAGIFGRTQDHIYLSATTPRGGPPQTSVILKLDKNFDTVWKVQHAGYPVLEFWNTSYLCNYLGDRVLCRFGQKVDGNSVPDTLVALDAKTGTETMPEMTMTKSKVDTMVGDVYTDAFTVDDKTYDFTGKVISENDSLMIYGYPRTSGNRNIFFKREQLMKSAAWSRESAVVVVNAEGHAKYSYDIGKKELTNVETGFTFAVAGFKTISADGRLVLAQDINRADDSAAIHDGATGQALVKTGPGQINQAICDSWLWVAAGFAGGQKKEGYILVPNS